MKFLRHLGALTLVVAIIVLAAIAWNHFWPGILTGQRAGHVPPGAHFSGPLPGPGPGGRGLTLPDGKDNMRVVTSRPGAGMMSLLFTQVNLQVLAHTAKAEAAFIAVVVIIDMIRRRDRRIRRGGSPRARGATAAGSGPVAAEPPLSGPAE